jgi:hypothetical protein
VRHLEAMDSKSSSIAPTSSILRREPALASAAHEGILRMSALGRGYRAMTAEVGAGTARLTVFLTVLFFCALAFAVACLVGIRRTDTLLESGQAQRAFEAVKQHAGPRMLVRNLVVKPDELSVWAMDPDMSPWRTTPGSRYHSAHTYFVAGVFEQSWRVRHWKVFWSEWYWVSGPAPEGRIEQDRGPAFDLKPGDIPDLPALAKKAARSIVGDAPAELTEVKIDSKEATVWVTTSKGISWVSLDRHTPTHTEQ